MAPQLPRNPHRPSLVSPVLVLPELGISPAHIGRGFSLISSAPYPFPSRPAVLVLPDPCWNSFWPDLCKAGYLL